MEHPAGVPLLLVEDDPFTRHLYRRLLEARGFAVATAADGREAIGLLGSLFRPRCILLDLRMPGMSGPEFRRRQLQDPLLADIPVVVFSAEEAAAREAAGLGAAGFLAKPAGMEALLE